MLLSLAWRNLWRQPRRTALNLLSIAFASTVMVFLLSFQLGTYATMKENLLRILDGFAQVQPQGYQADPDLKKRIQDPEQLMAGLKKQFAGVAMAPRATTFAILSLGEKSVGAALMGVDPAREVQVTRLHSSMVQGRYLEAGDSDAIVLGSSLARNLGVKAGDSLTLLGEGLDGSIAADVLEVVGIFSTGTADIDRQFSQMPLRRFQSTFAMGKAVNLVALSGPSLAAINQALPALVKALQGQGLAVQPWQALEPGMDGAISLDLNTSLMWYVSLVIVVVFIVLNTLLMSVLERTREFGVLLAIGMGPGRIGAMIWLELMLLAFFGLALGIAIGGAITLVTGHYGMSMPGAEAIFSQWGLPGKLYPRLSLLSLSAGPGAMALCIFLSGFIPYLKVRRLAPVDAMRAA
ncbi:ABC transporter permease [Gallaecimonas kandeliae]|uniref:ABC transporter permease n=1 Tax=Gallaecimonas kandeliae TaxID=3029055 RepID=UPI002647AA49|nr:FtsX-like permease family protein [Gallaecimonas kandeliae]WKE65249.1 ABC transporter permease [Gallaecimonas kandeliae]